MSELSVVFFGTGSARPTPRRNVAGVGLVYGGETLLFDCGEGTQLQALKAGFRTSRLRAVCITHFHGDHINGLPGFLGTMGLNGHRDPVVVAGPAGLKRYFKTLRELSILHPSFRLDLVDHELPVVVEGGGYRVRTCALEHRVPTQGFLFEEAELVGRFDVARARALGIPPGPLYGQLQGGHAVQLDDGRTVRPEEVLGPSRPGRRVAYISDTRPTAQVVEFVRGADLLLHEATYLDEFRDQAIERGHSTVAEAAQVAAEAGVKELVLTHISPKHTRTKELLDEARRYFEPVVVAEDLLTLKIPVPA